VLFKIESPRMLHLATHGYFLPDEEVTDQAKKMLSAQEMKATVDIGLANPMTRSALVLAGANTSIKEGRDDGIVSAEKVLGLRLRGTELVVLSACETGLGDVKNGEGVFGLKRAFILAGAKTVVMSLWSVPSEETTQLMTDFYEFMSQGKDKAQSLREAKLRMLRDHPNPFYWAAFLLTGGVRPRH
jgi:CHAT domain-containing protein